MNIADKVSEISTSVTVTIITAVGGAAIWLVRRIFTNQQQIEMRAREIEHRDQLRKMDRSDITDVKDSVKRIEGFLMEGRK